MMIIRESIKAVRPCTRSFFFKLKPFSRKNSDNTDPLITVDTLHKILMDGKKNVKLIDSAWYMPNDSRTGQGEFLKETIPG